MDYSTATADEIKANKKNWVSFGEMMMYWKLKGMTSFQGKMGAHEKTRIATNTDTIVIVHLSEYNSESHMIDNMVIYEGQGYSFRPPIFQTMDRLTAMTKLQEFF